MLFYNDEYRKVFLEDADDNQDDNANTGNDQQDEQDADAEANAPDEGGGDEGGDNPEDFDMPDEGGGEGGDEGGEGEEGGEEGDGMGGDEGGDDMGGDAGSTDDPLKNIESEIFANMSSEQLAIRNKELKNRYMEMYDNIQSIMDRLNEIHKTNNIIRPITFISKKLDQTATMIADYLTYTFDTLGYVENEINFNKFYSILVGVDNMFRQIVVNNKMDKPKPNERDIDGDDIPVGV